jgi:hypothetical protein
LVANIFGTWTFQAPWILGGGEERLGGRRVMKSGPGRLLAPAPGIIRRLITGISLNNCEMQHPGASAACSREGGGGWGGQQLALFPLFPSPLPSSLCSGGLSARLCIPRRRCVACPCSWMPLHLDDTQNRPHNRERSLSFGSLCSARWRVGEEQQQFRRPLQGSGQESSAEAAAGTFAASFGGMAAVEASCRPTEQGNVIVGEEQQPDACTKT